MREDLRGAGVQQVHQHSLALLHANRFARAHRLVVDGVQAAADFEAVRPRVRLGRLLGHGIVRDPARFHRSPPSSGTAPNRAATKTLPDRSGPDCSRTRSAENRTGRCTRRGADPSWTSCACDTSAIPRARDELIALAAVRRHHRRALFLGAVNFRGNIQPVPMHQFRRVGIVDDVHGDRAAPRARA